jgi:hypothetical protein
MARIAHLQTINNEKVALLNIARNADESVLVTADETRDVIKNFIIDELSFFADENINFRKSDFEYIVADKINKIELSLNEMINKKFDKLTERIVRETKESVIEAEVNKRLEIKLQKIRESL